MCDCWYDTRGRAERTRMRPGMGERWMPDVDRPPAPEQRRVPGAGECCVAGYLIVTFTFWSLPPPVDCRLMGLTQTGPPFTLYCHLPAEIGTFAMICETTGAAGTVPTLKRVMVPVSTVVEPLTTHCVPWRWHCAPNWSSQTNQLHHWT